jgi:hypothetical protein
MKILQSIYAWPLLALLCATLTGCGGGKAEAPKFPVSGTVTLDGQPLADGMIYFKDIAQGVADSAEIKNGQFSGKAEAGQRRVEIFAYQTQTSDMGGTVSETKFNVVPPRFNAQSTLTADVKSDGANTFKFEIASS